MTIRRGNSIIAGNAVDIPSQTGQSGKFLTTNGTTTSWAAVNVDTSDIYNKIDAKQDKSTAINYNNISNCITYIPQDIKLELNNGTLTLKAGSKVYVPNGAVKFDKVTITQDVSDGADSNRESMLFYKVGKNSLEPMPVEFCFSGSTAPTSFLTGKYAVWYDTTNNVIKLTKNGGTNWDSGYSFPICLAHETTRTYAISQVFNGFGYIGSTIYALPGVKGLIPNGRNTDGSLKNLLSINDSVHIYTLLSSETNENIPIYVKQNGSIFRAMKHIYDEKNNFNLNFGDINYCYVGSYVSYVNGKITSFTPKTTFHALDYNDKSTISGWGMPSNRYIDLTLGASGSTYTAPANGWFNFDKRSSAAGQYVVIGNETGGYVWEGSSTAYGVSVECNKSVPVKKSDVIKITYTLGGATMRFAFIYAEGNKPSNVVSSSDGNESGSIGPGDIETGPWD